MNRILKQRIDVAATLVEPASPMFQQAELLLHSYQVSLINSTLHEALPVLDCQDAFLFCRSLYAFSCDIESYQTIFLQLSKALSTFGQIFVYEISGLYNIDLYKKKLEVKFINKKELFKQHWPVLEFALQRFNDGVTKGGFMLFSRDQLEKVASEAGFNLVYYSNLGLYCFRKQYKPSC